MPELETITIRDFKGHIGECGKVRCNCLFCTALFLQAASQLVRKFKKLHEHPSDSMVREAAKATRAAQGWQIVVTRHWHRSTDAAFCLLSTHPAVAGVTRCFDTVPDMYFQPDFNIDDPGRSVTMNGG